jgi:hypothetical protein
MKLKEFIPQLKNAVQEGASTALSQCAIRETVCSKAEAYRLFGRSDVDRWIAGRLLTPIAKNGNVSKMIDRIQLERVAAASNRHSYLPVAER